MIVYLTEEKPMLVRVHRRVCVEQHSSSSEMGGEEKNKKVEMQEEKKEELLAHGRGGCSPTSK